MNKDNAKDYLPLVQALAEGKVIQSYDNYGRFTDLIDVSFDDLAANYRIKPEPREIWANRYESGREVSGYVSRGQAVQQAYEAGERGAVQVLYREVIE